MFDVPALVFSEAEKIHIKVNYDTISLINHLRSSRPKSFKARCISEPIEVYLAASGEIYFG
jgi:transcriptional regulator